MSFIEIPPSESGLPSALEQYYKELNVLVGERNEQPLLLNNTITTFDITDEAPFYTEGVFRRFADRKFRVSPQDLGSAVEAERFSHEYERVIKIATSHIDQTIPDEVRQRIENIKREIRRLNRELIQFEANVQTGWETIASNEGLSPEMPRYQLRRINYYESILYADQKKQFTEEIEEYQRNINTLRNSSYSSAQQKLIRSMDELAETYKVARPWNTYFERDFPDATILTFADPTIRSRQFCDVSPAVYPSINLLDFQARPVESRGISVSQGTIHNQLHTRTWGVGGSGSFRAFGIRIGGGGGGSGSSSYRKDFRSLLSFDMDFAGIEEVYVNRGLWFDPSLFENEELKPIFDGIPGARDLEFVAVSVILGKGLKLSLNFEEEVETESWTRRRFRGRGGVSIFGFRFGGSASRTTYDYDFKRSEDNKTVTFQDDASHCRLLAVRLERIYHPISIDDPERRPLWSDAAIEALYGGVATGKISLADYQAIKLRGFAPK